MARPGSTFIRIVLGGAVLALLASFALNTLVDPWRVNRMPWSLESLDPFREISRQQRTSKAGLAASRDDWQAACFGSSRVAIAFDPTHPAWGGLRTVNLGLSAASFTENEAICRHLMAHSPELELVLIGFDPGDLTSDRDSRPIADFAGSPLDPRASRLDRRLRYLVGISTLEASLATIARSVANEEPEYTPLGQWIHYNRPPNIRAEIAAHARAAGGALPDLWKPREANPAKVESLTRLVDELQQRGVRVVLFLPAQHALGKVHPSEEHPDRAPWQDDRSILATVAAEATARHPDLPPVTFWDFDNYSGPCAEALPPIDQPAAEMHWWTDLGHARSICGDLMIEAMLGSAPDSFGSRVTDLPAHLESLRADHADYRAAQADDVGWLLDLNAP